MTVPPTPATQSSFPELLLLLSAYHSRDRLGIHHCTYGHTAIPFLSTVLLEVCHIHSDLFLLICFEDHPLLTCKDLPPHYFFLSLLWFAFYYGKILNIHKMRENSLRNCQIPGIHHQLGSFWRLLPLCHHFITLIVPPSPTPTPTHQNRPWALSLDCCAAHWPICMTL